MRTGLQRHINTIGEMDELVSFYSVTESPDTGGALTETLVLVLASLRAKVTFINTDESAAGAVKQEKFRTEILVQCRYSSTLEDPKLRMLWRSKYYDITAIDTTARKRYLMIKGKNYTT